MNDPTDLTTPYTPVMIWYPEARCAEWVDRDTAAIYDEIQPGVAVVRDMHTREIIGFRIYEPKAWAEAVMQT